MEHAKTMRAKNMLITVVLSLVLGGMVTPPALADRWGHGDIHRFHERDWGDWHRGRWDHDWHGGRFGWWWVVGGVWFFYPRPVYPYPDPYLPPDYVVATGTPPPAYWYYCPTARTYYPYVQACPVPWQPVPASPP